ncbi:MAG: DNA gyrase subunit A [Bdellovibrionales bacterium]
MEQDQPPAQPGEGNGGNKNIIPVDINTEMKEAYLQYSMSVIVGRALPDVRDGLKPVHRRVLFSMYESGYTHDKPYKKSARVVGDVIGKYHPHGDSAVYDTIVRMAQDFSMRYVMIDGQGNFGSIDGDNAAHMRYTEVRMTDFAEELLADLDKETVPFGPNYDDSLQIPHVLPAKYPNLMVNGSTGIAVGMATNIPPHNLTEVVSGCIALIKNPELSIDELIEIIPGPDFPSAGEISGREGILSAYKKGRGIISVRAVSEVIANKQGREQIIVTELPYMVNKARLIENIADMVKDKKIEGISDIRDESSREGMRIVFDIKRGENAEVIANRLYKFTQMQTSFGIIMLALDAKNQPKIFNLKSMLAAFLDHRKEVVTRRCIFELKKAEARIHILNGLKMALDQIDAVVATIRACKEPNEARVALVEKFKFSEIQAQAILEMRLQRLTGLERQKIQAEIDDLEKTISWLKKVLGDPEEISKIIVGELEEVRKKFGDDRRTKITGDMGNIDDEDLITEEDVVVTFTHTGYIKRISIDEYRSQRRGGKGIKGMETREEDFVSNLFVASTLTTLLVFTDKGKIYWLKVHKLPQGNRTSKGKFIANVLKLGETEKVQAILPVQEFEDDKFVVFVTKKGVVKKTPLSAFSNPRPSGIIALTIDLNDSLISAKLSSGKDDIFVVTKEGMSIRFTEDDVRAMGRAARGVKAINLVGEDEVVGVEVLLKDSKKAILILTSHGYGKRTEMEEYRPQGRGGTGIITQKTTDKIGNVVGTLIVSDDDDIMIITDKGQIIRTRCKEISMLGRNTQGVRVISLNEGELASCVALVADNEDDETKAPGEPTH